MRRLMLCLGILVLLGACHRKPAPDQVDSAARNLGEIATRGGSEANALWLSLAKHALAGEVAPQGEAWLRLEQQRGIEIDRWLASFSAPGPRADLLRARAHNLRRNGKGAIEVLAGIPPQQGELAAALLSEKIKALAIQHHWVDAAPLLEQAEKAPWGDVQAWTHVQLLRALGDWQAGGDAALFLLSHPPQAELEVFRPAWVAAGALTLAAQGRQAEARQLSQQGLSRASDPAGKELLGRIVTQIDLIGQVFSDPAVDVWLTPAQTAPGKKITLVFALDCPHCLGWLRALQQVFPRLRERQIEVVAIARLTGHAGPGGGATPRLAEATEITARQGELLAMGITLPVGISREGAVHEALAVTQLPVIVVAESDRRISRIVLCAIEAPEAAPALIESL